MNHILRHLQPIRQTKIILAVVISLFSLYLLYEGMLFGLILLAVGIKLSLRTGIEVDLHGKCYRTIYSIFGTVFGSWKNLPEIEYISVFKTKKKSRARVITAEASLDFVVYKLNLFYDRNQHIEAYVTEHRDNAFEVANQMANVLKTEIYDATND
ncbi:MAG: hypothetical protein AAFP76_00285 [Bacteroidota bacterium]